MYLWTKLGSRLKRIRSSGKKKLNWIFIPGGPGLGSEAIAPLTSILKLPGTMWHLDLPGDGSNLRGSFKNWKRALLEAVRTLDNVIIVGHSRGGMFALATPELQHLLKGLVLLDAAPDRTWKEKFADRIQRFPLPKKTLAFMRKHEQAYSKKPSNTTLKNFVLSGTPYMFLKAYLEKGTRTLKKLPYNSKAIQWTEAHFDPTYKARWIPNIPTLILSGDNDQATPLELFQKKEFKRKNIVMKEIKKAGHFPWIENPKDVIAAFNSFLTVIDT
jgi:pimeloyl-ACP methyl ester carboxylesterase